MAFFRAIIHTCRLDGTGKIFKSVCEVGITAPCLQVWIFLCGKICARTATLNQLQHDQMTTILVVKLLVKKPDK